MAAVAQRLHRLIAMMIAIPVWNGRISPVFDVAKMILVVDVDIDRGVVVAKSTHTIGTGTPASTLAALGIDLLVCSAVSPPTEAAVSVSGVKVIPDICGSPDEIVEALAAGDAELSRFRSPGSRHRYGSDSARLLASER